MQSQSLQAQPQCRHSSHGVPSTHTLAHLHPPRLAAGMAVTGARDGAAALYHGLLTSSATKGAVTYFADNVLLSGTFLDVKVCAVQALCS